VHEARQEGVLDHVRDLLGEQVGPLLILSDFGCHELLVESVLPGPGEKARLFGPGWPKVGWLDLCRSAPHLYVSRQVSRHWATPFHSPGRYINSPRRSDLISEIHDQSGTGGKVGSPVGVCGDASGDAGQPRQRYGGL
jgi:hypothetical protein